MEFSRLTEADVPSCLQSLPALRERFSAFDVVEAGDGNLKVADIANIEDLQARAGAAIAALRIAERLLLERRAATSIQHVLDWVHA